MKAALFYILSSFWAGAVHAATPGHGKTIAAAYIVGARGRPIDAVILGVFVTLSHTSGIVIVGTLASLGTAWFVPQRAEAYLALAMGILVIGLGAWMLWTQRGLIPLALGEPGRALGPAAVPAGVAPSAAGSAFAAPEARREQAHHWHDHPHVHDHGHAHDGEHPHGHDHADDHVHDHDHPHGHTHGWGTYHAHRLDLVTDNRPKLAVLLTLSIAGGLLPDPAALAILLAALSNGQVLLGVATVLVFSLGFASALVVVGVIAAQLGRKIEQWFDSIWAIRVQIATSLLILVMGVVLTGKAVYQLAPARF